MEPEGVYANDSTGSATSKAETPGDSVSRQTKVETPVDSVSRQTKVEKYNLRRSSLVKRLQIEEKSRLPREPKPKVKPPPLSKYRRRSANARERNRMNEMNVGFERLREALPDLDSSKMTKLALLRLAMNYITSLRSILDNPSSTDNLSTSSDGETISPDTPLTSGLPFNLPADNSEFGSCSDLTSCFSYNNTCRGSGFGSSYCTSSGESSGGSTYSSSSGDEASFSPVSDFLLSDGCADDLINLNLDDLLS